MTQGYYCLIQYCPDASRAEAANVGLLIYQTEPPATAVRVVDDVRPAMKRLGQRGKGRSLLRVVESTKYRIEREQIRSLEALEKFVRTRGNEIQMTMPRPMRIEAVERDLDALFHDLVGDTRLPAARADASMPVAIGAEASEPTLLQRTFVELARAHPESVYVDAEFHARGLGIPVRADYAYRNGYLNIVQEMPSTRDAEELEASAFAVSRQGQLVQRLEEGEGRLIVVANAVTAGRKAIEREQRFADLIEKLGDAEFVPSSRLLEFTQRVEAELAGH